MAFIDSLREIGIVAVIRGSSCADAIRKSKALIAGGITGIELTYSTPDCCTAIREVCALQAPGVAVGVGTVRSVEQLAAAVAAGATYAVSPHFSPAIAAAARELGCPYLPGCITPTEIVTAWEAGVACIKLFPGSLVGPDYVKALRGPLPEIPLMPTGGVSEDNLHEWFTAGVVAVGMGGKLASGEPDAIEAAARRSLQALRQSRSAAA